MDGEIDMETFLTTGLSRSVRIASVVVSGGGSDLT